MKNEFHISVGSQEPKVTSRPATLEGLESRQLMSATAHIKGEVFAAGQAPEQLRAVEVSLQYAGSPEQATNDAPSWQVEGSIIGVLKKAETNPKGPKTSLKIDGIRDAVSTESAANAKGPRSSLKIDGIRDAVITIRKAGGQ
jgi:hypothetical protein